MHCIVLYVLLFIVNVWVFGGFALFFWAMLYTVYVLFMSGLVQSALQLLLMNMIRTINRKIDIEI